MTLSRYHLSVVALLFCLLLALLPLHAGTGEQLSKMLTVTLTVYALARSLNAVISIAQGTEVSIEPMGVGVTLTPGEILDPLNDLIEQFSSILLLASASLGVQQIMLMFGDTVVLRGILAGLSMISLLLVWKQYLPESAYQKLVKVVLVLTMLRLVVPGLALISYYAQNSLTHEREQALLLLHDTRDQVDEMNVETRGQDDSWLQGFKNNLDLSARLNAIENKAEQGVSAVVQLLAEFVLIMIILPLLFLYLALKLLTWIRIWS